MRIGEEINVKVARYDSKRGRPGVVGWRHAIVTDFTDDVVYVKYEDGTRHAIERGRHKFRRVRRDKDMG